MTYYSFKELEQRYQNAVETETKIHAELVALSIVCKVDNGYFKSDHEMMSARTAAEIIAEIEHPEIDKLDCNFQKVYDDLNDRYTKAKVAAEAAAEDRILRGNEIRLRAIQQIENGKLKNLQQIVHFLQTGGENGLAGQREE